MDGIYISRCAFAREIDDALVKYNCAISQLKSISKIRMVIDSSFRETFSACRMRKIATPSGLFGTFPLCIVPDVTRFNTYLYPRAKDLKLVTADCDISHVIRKSHKLYCGKPWALSYDRKHETISRPRLNNIIGKMRKTSVLSRGKIFLLKARDTAKLHLFICCSIP